MAAGRSGSGRPRVRVFISYAHASAEHVQAVRDLWLFLRSQGIDAKVDMSAADHPQDWALWILEQVREADYVLVVASAPYRRRAEGLAAPDESRGVPYEAALIREAMYADPAAARRKYLPVLLADERVEDIPAFLGPTSTTHYRVRSLTAAELGPLLRLLTGAPGSAEAELGRVPPRQPAGQRRRAGEAESGRIPLGDLGELTDRLLEVSELSSPTQWQQVIDLLPGHLAQVIPRQRSGRAEAIALLRTCEHHPHSWTDLVQALRLVGPHSAAVQRFAEEVTRLGLAVGA